MHFYEGQIGSQTWFGLQFLAFSDALGLGLVEAVDDVAHFGQVVGIEDSCLEPRPSSRHNWLWRERQLGAALMVGRVTGRSFDEDYFVRCDQPVHVWEEVLHFFRRTLRTTFFCGKGRMGFLKIWAK